MTLPNPLYALVTEQEKRQTKNGGRYFWQVSLKTTVGNVKAFMWNATPDAETNARYPHTGDVLEVVDFEDQMDDRGSIIINAFKRLPREEVPEDSKGIFEFQKASEEDMRWALNIIGDGSFWKDKAHHKFTMGCLAEFDKEKLRACPAATHIHHNYHGGLLVHTAEVLELCKTVAETCVVRYPFINKDVLYSSAILHDIGKVETYYINDIGVAHKLASEEKIGHLFYGMHVVQQVARKHKKLTEFTDEVLHCIAAHHGHPEYGSIKVVQSVEAGILSRLDYISSRNGMVKEVLEAAQKSGQPLQDSFRIYGDSYFASIGMKEFVEGG
jgi:3'-5' exoribonuclease